MQSLRRQMQSLRRHRFLHLLHDTSPNTTKRATPTPHIVHLINQPRPEPYSIVVVLFSWVVLHVPLKTYNLINKHRQKYGQGHLPFSNEKLLLLLFSSCSHGKLDLQFSNSDSSTRSNHGQTYKANKIQLRTLHHNKRKALKERTKGQVSLLRLRERKKHGKRSQDGDSID